MEQRIRYYDEVIDFTRMDSSMEKVEIAVSRMENPYGLDDDKILMYQNYLFGKEPEKLVYEFIDNNRVRFFPMLVKYKIIKKTNVIKFTDYAREKKKNDILFYLMEAGNQLRFNAKNMDLARKHTPGKTPLPPAENTADYSTAKPGEIIWLGIEATPWQVLENKNGRLFLISKYILDCLPVDDFFRGQSYWCSCSMRRRLNREYINNLLTKEEQARIVPVYIEDSDRLHFEKQYGISEDRFFHLSVGEAQRFFRTQRDRIAPITKYAVRSMLWTVFDQTGHWWLRTPGELKVDYYYVRDGVIMSENSTVQTSYFEHFGVRPAFYYHP